MVCPNPVSPVAVSLDLSLCFLLPGMIGIPALSPDSVRAVSGVYKGRFGWITWSESDQFDTFTPAGETEVGVVARHPASS
jgi:hypothetical protein